MAAGHFRVEYEERPEGGHVARLTIDNAAKLNSLNSGLMQEIIDKMTGVAADPDLRLAILTGAGGRAFVGGADIPRSPRSITPAPAVSSPWSITAAPRSVICRCR